MGRELENLPSGGTQSTKDYNKFKKLAGNRPADPAHVKRIQNNMLAVGNLTAEFPIVVNENYEVIDGQHRLEALKGLGWPVAYRVVNGLTLDTVRGINQAAQNWSWKDYAESFSKDGSEEQRLQYRRFLQLWEQFGRPQYSVLRTFTGVKNIGSRSGNLLFKQGDMVIPNFERAYKLLSEYTEVALLLEMQREGRFAFAFHRIMQSPEYDHARMVHKAKVYDLEAKKLSTVEDYLRFIESVYNRNQPEETRVRLY